MPPRHRLRTWLGGFAVVALLYYAYFTLSSRMSVEMIGSGFPDQRADCGRGKERLGEGDKTVMKGVDELGEVRVPLEAHIMSKCLDAQVWYHFSKPVSRASIYGIFYGDCLKMLVLPTMQQVVDKVNFTLSFIGAPTDNDGVDCKHGPPECLGNIIELCAASLYPDPKTYLGFTMCLTRDYKDIPAKSLVEDCALEHGIDFKKLDECAVEDNGGKVVYREVG
ncbi:hypothetical protein BJ875DRAFT_481002 [Amylocarpus encephaloides]|uniref:Gamma interferon inducible lysosomal thiol reductase n=1 Tax=Amylocarpus encephaloides TaxID=45428 RepID=A0A9P7YQ05_9HELO|nr:hypothetical protein BJ875DRAFT_481002 [Amylocarpus encephaloides]